MSKIESFKSRKLRREYLIFLILIILGSLAVVYSFIKIKGTSSRANGESIFQEAESGTITGSVTISADSNASGGSYIQFGTTSSSFQPPAAYYATFF